MIGAARHWQHRSQLLPSHPNSTWIRAWAKKENKNSDSQRIKANKAGVCGFPWLQLWDTGGALQCRRLGRGFWQKSAALLVVFDLADASSFAALDQLCGLYQDQVFSKPQKEVWRGKRHPLMSLHCDDGLCLDPRQPAEQAPTFVMCESERHHSSILVGVSYSSVCWTVRCKASPEPEL